MNLDERLKDPPKRGVDGDAKAAGDPPCGYDCYKYLSDEDEVHSKPEFLSRPCDSQVFMSRGYLSGMMQR